MRIAELLDTKKAEALEQDGGFTINFEEIKASVESESQVIPVDVMSDFDKFNAWMEEQAK